MKSQLLSAARRLGRALVSDPALTFWLWMALVVISLRADDRLLQVNTWMNPTIDLAGFEFTERPRDWRDREEALQAHLRNWCAEKLGPSATQQAQGCDSLDDDGRKALASDEAKWADKRDQEIRNLKKMDLALKNFSGADLREAFLTGADLRGTWLKEANLRLARMEKANLRLVRMEDANLSEARMEGSDFTLARMEGVDLGKARMEGVNLTMALMDGANLAEARMDEAVLDGARLEGALLWETGLKSTDLRVWSIRGSALRSVDLTEAEYIFGSRMLKTAFGDGSVKLPAGWSPPAHWTEEAIEDDDEFYGRWHGWRESEGLRWPPPGKALEDLSRYEKIEPD
jgi:uncharacterized protein YjbI with pentapeptide repeats